MLLPLKSSFFLNFTYFNSSQNSTRRTNKPFSCVCASVRVCVLFPLNNNLMREKAKQMQGTMLLSGVNRIPVVLPPLLLFLLLAAATPGEFLFCLLLHFISFYFFFTLHSTESHCSSSLDFFPSAPPFFFQYVFGVPFFFYLNSSILYKFKIENFRVKNLFLLVGVV